jgi:hypothetical protein
VTARPPVGRAVSGAGQTMEEKTRRRSRAFFHSLFGFILGVSAAGLLSWWAATKDREERDRSIRTIEKRIDEMRDQLMEVEKQIRPSKSS